MGHLFEKIEPVMASLRQDQDEPVRNPFLNGLCYVSFSAAIEATAKTRRG